MGITFNATLIVGFRQEVLEDHKGINNDIKDLLIEKYGIFDAYDNINNFCGVCIGSTDDHIELSLGKLSGEIDKALIEIGNSLKEHNIKDIQPKIYLACIGEG